MDSKYLIIGAGYAGLQLACALVNLKPEAPVSLIEKSRGVGGRLATRRDGQFSFDHGAQFIKQCALNENQIQDWNTSGILQPLSDNTYSSFGGITRIAKKLAEGKNIYFERKILRISQDQKRWTALDDQGATYFTENVILSCPLPQSLEILRNSGLTYDPSLDLITYAKAIVFLIKDERVLEFIDAYQEPRNSAVFSVTSQFKKGTSILPCWTITMTTKWSEQNFDKADTEIIKAAEDHIYEFLPHVSLENISVKKWRFSHPLSTFKDLYTSPAKNLYLIGDAFGGASLNGAHRSAHALAEHLERL